MKSLVKSAYKLTAISGIITFALFAFAGNAMAAAAPTLGTASSFAALGTAVTLTSSTVTGDVGSTISDVSTTTSTVNGTTYPGADSAVVTAYNDFLSAYGVVGATAMGTTTTGTLADQTLTPGVYSFDTSSKTGTLTLDAQGDPNAVWIFKSTDPTDGYLEATSFNIVFKDGVGSARNVFWWTGKYAAVTTSDFQGTILSGTYVTVTGGTLAGRALATAGVTVTTSSTVTAPSTPPSSGPVFIDTNTNNTLDQGESFFQTIQSAVNAAVNNDTIYVTAGTYDEQVVINGKNLTLQGAGDTTIIAPSSPSKLTTLYTYPSGVYAPWVGVKLAAVITVINSSSTVKNLKIDGASITNIPTGAARLSAVLYGESGGLISHVTANSIKTTGYLDRTYVIDVSATGAAKSVEIANNTINDYARTAIQVQGASLTANIHNNTITGPGHITGQVPNGIVFIHGVAGNATANTIHGLWYDVPNSSESYGIMVFDPVTSGIVIEGNEVYDTQQGIGMSTNANGAIVQQNNLHNNGVGVHLESGTTGNTITDNTIVNNTVAGIRLNGPDSGDIPGTGNVAHSNTITGNAVGVLNLDAGHTFNATNNWWGNASGPLATTTPILNLTGTGNAAVGNISYSPWYTDSLLNHLKGTITTPIDNEASTTIPTATTQSGSDNNGGTVTADIPSGTVVTGDSSWDGLISAPTPPVTTPIVTISGFDTAVTSAFTVGSNLSDLTFDNAVKLTFAGQAGSLVGYYNHAGNFATIPACGAGSHDQAWADNDANLAVGADCTFDSGSDLIVWTKHFSTFVTYTQTATPVPAAPQLGGGHRSQVATAGAPVGQVLGAFVGPEGTNLDSPQVTAIKTQIIALLKQLIALLQAQLVAAIAAGLH